MVSEKEEKFEYESKKIPTDPGCYLFLDDKEKIIYVGKAKNLRKRVNSYFQKTKKSPKTASLVKKIRGIQTRTVSTEMEALILENSLIKQHRPKYNILLRDDKNFLYLRITREDIPKLELTRRLVRDGSTYIGPRTSAKSFRKTIAFCQKFFGVRMVNPSLDNYVAKAIGSKLSPEEYRVNINQMKKFLRGDVKEVLGEIKERMMKFAKERNFEAAAKMRDLIEYIGGSTNRQNIEFSDHVSRDFIHFVREGREAYFVRLVWRGGKFVDQNELMFRVEEFHSDAELLESFLLQFYPAVDALPREIYVPVLPENQIQTQDYLLEKFETENGKLEIKVPQKGDKLRVLEIAAKNAQNFLAKAQVETLSQAENFAKALPELAEKLGLSEPPRRMECYDISHFSGHETVASQVTFVDGTPYKAAYRRYKLRTIETGEVDDFKSMKEVLGRRFKGIEELKNNAEEGKVDWSIKKLETEAEKRTALEFGNVIFNDELGFPSEIEERHLDEEKNKIWAAYKKDKMVGIIRGGEFTKTLWQIRGLAVDKESRRQGLARDLVDVFREYLGENNVKKIFVLSDKAALDFYITYGFGKNDKPIKKVQAYIEKLKEEYAETNTIWESYEIKVARPKQDETIPDYPDLVVIDGGKGQLSSVLETLYELKKQNNDEFPLDLSTQVIALAKREEEVFRGQMKDGSIVFEQLSINNNSAASKLLQRIRDEAHRFAITYNKNLRKKSAYKSILDEIAGIGGTTKKKLLQTFGSVSNIRNASDEELIKVVSKKQLTELRKNL